MDELCQFRYFRQAMFEYSLLSGGEVVKLHSAAWLAVLPEDTFCRYSIVPGSWRYTSQGVFAALWDGENSTDYMRINLTEWGHKSTRSRWRGSRRLRCPYCLDVLRKTV